MYAKLAGFAASPLDRGWIIAAASLAALPALAAGPTVHWATDQLSVRARGEPLGLVLREISVQTGVSIQGGYALLEPVASDLSDVSLVAGLRRLLAGQNYLIVEEPRQGPADPTVTRVVVLANLGSSAARPVTEAQPASMAPAMKRGGAGGTGPDIRAQRSPAAAAAERELMEADPAVRIGAVEALGRRSDEGSLALLRGALSDPNEAVRAVAVEALNIRRGAAPVAVRPGP